MPNLCRRQGKETEREQDYSHDRRSGNEQQLQDHPGQQSKDKKLEEQTKATGRMNKEEKTPLSTMKERAYTPEGGIGHTEVPPPAQRKRSRSRRENEKQ